MKKIIILLMCAGCATPNHNKEIIQLVDRYNYMRDSMREESMRKLFLLDSFYKEGNKQYQKCMQDAAVALNCTTPSCMSKARKMFHAHRDSMQMFYDIFDSLGKKH